jgi:hypothetical protein
LARKPFHPVSEGLPLPSHVGSPASNTPVMRTNTTRPHDYARRHMHRSLSQALKPWLNQF